MQNSVLILKDLYYNKLEWARRTMTEENMDYCIGVLDGLFEMVSLIIYNSDITTHVKCHNVDFKKADPTYVTTADFWDVSYDVFTDDSSQSFYLKKEDEFWGTLGTYVNMTIDEILICIIENLHTNEKIKLLKEKGLLKDE